MDDFVKDATSSALTGASVPVSNTQGDAFITASYASTTEQSAMETTDSNSLAISSNVESMDIISSFLPDVPSIPSGNAENVSKKAVSSDVTMQSTNLDDLSTSKHSESMEVFANNSKSSAMDVESISVKSELISESVAKSLQRQAMTPPLYSPTRSLTPMSEKIEGVSPVELIETSDGSVRIKGELDASHLSASSTPCRSRSSSQSSKSSKGSPKSRRSPSTKAKKKRPPPAKDGEHSDKNDFYCWVCHKEGEVLCCELCPRVVHGKCLNLVTEPEGDWYCPECEKIMVAECKETQTRSMSQLTIDQLALHLRYALQRMKTSGCEPFLEPVNTKDFTDYVDYVFHPMDLNTLERNIKKKTYGSTEAFLADVKWILHNCVIYNGPNTKLTQVAKVIVKIAQHEMSEIEVCPECYLNACRKRDNWFCEPCRDVHVLVWAKLQGFPHWPAKALRIEKGLVDVRFFGQHDRAWVPLANCYLMSKEMPLPVKNKKKGRGPGAKGGLDSAMQEAQCYIDNVVKKSGTFEHAPPRTPLTHLDLCRKPTTGQTVSKTSGEKIMDPTPEDNSALITSVHIKKEAIEEEKMKGAADSTKSSSGNRILNLKIGPAASDINLTPASVPTKKKSKVVTTSGAHPEKGYRPYDPKKKASHVLLEKTIASLRDNIEDKSDDSSSDSDSSLEEEIDTSSLNSSTSPDKGKKTDASNPEEKKSKQEGDSDTNLIIDEVDASKKKDSAVSALLEKNAVKLKKQSAGDGEARPKTRSILLNKDPDRKSASPAPTSLGGSIKRKHNEDSSSSSKIRKVDNTNANKSASNHQKTLAKVNPVKDRKHSSDNDKQKKSSEFLSKTKKEGVSPHAGSIQKKTVSADASKKKIMLSSAAKPRSEEGEKADLKTTAKMLAKKMARKQSALAEKTKTTNTVTAKTVPVQPPIDFAAKKLSSFTIPKHKPSPARNEPSSDSPSNNTASKFSNHTSQNTAPTQQARFPTVNVPLQKLKKYNEKITQNVQNIIVEMYEDMLAMFKNAQGSLSTSNNAISSDMSVASQQQVTKLQLEIEQLKWSHQQQLAELQHNHDLTIAEIRQSLENEKLHMLESAKRKSEAEKTKAITDAKKKQWCANCWKEAVLYCCWNTTYCDYPCQQIHWPKHQAVCSQAEGKGATSSNVHAAPETPTKAAARHERNTSVKDISADKESVSSSVTPTKEKIPEKSKSVSLKIPEEIPSNDDEHSDTDMMVIDETDKPDILSPTSPDDLKSTKIPNDDVKSTKTPNDDVKSTKTSQDDVKSANTSHDDLKSAKTSHDDVKSTKTSHDDVKSAKTPHDDVRSAKMSASKSPPAITLAAVQHPSGTIASGEIEKSVSSSSTTSAPFAGAVVSALTSDKIKPLLPKTTTSSITSGGTPSAAKLVPSKLIDDIFSKVHQEHTSTSVLNDPPTSQSEPRDTATSVAKTTPEPISTSSVADIDAPASAEAIASISQESKPQPGGSVLSAISDRLMKIKNKSMDSDDGIDAPTQPQLATTATSSADVVAAPAISTTGTTDVTGTGSPAELDLCSSASKPSEEQKKTVTAEVKEVEEVVDTLPDQKDEDEPKISLHLEEATSRIIDEDSDVIMDEQTLEEVKPEANVTQNNEEDDTNVQVSPDSPNLEEEMDVKEYALPETNAPTEVVDVPLPSEATGDSLSSDNLMATTSAASPVCSSTLTDSLVSASSLTTLSTAPEPQLLNESSEDVDMAVEEPEKDENAMNIDHVVGKESEI